MTTPIPPDPAAAAFRVAPQENAAAPAPEGPAHPAAPSGATSGATPSAVEQILAMRARQIEKFGHTPEADMSRPIADLVAVASDYTRYLREDVSCNAPLAAIKKHAAALGAMTLALIDRVEGEEAQRHG